MLNLSSLASLASLLTSKDVNSINHAIVSKAIRAACPTYLANDLLEEIEWCQANPSMNPDRTPITNRQVIRKAGAIFSKTSNWTDRDDYCVTIIASFLCQS